MLIWCSRNIYIINAENCFAFILWRTVFDIFCNIVKFDTVTYFEFNAE